MKFDPIVKRKIGSIEVLLFVIFAEILRLNALATIIYIAVLVAFVLGRSHFKEDFTLAQLYGLFVDPDKKDQEKTST